MFGFKLVPAKELQLNEDRLQDLKNLLDKMESELHYWRARADDERERADRINDTLMQMNGLPDTTPTVRREKAAQVEQHKELVEKHEAEVAEMFSESFDGSDDLNWVDSDLQVAARGWMEQAKQARESKKALHEEG